MSLTEKQRAELMADLPKSAVRTRQGAGSMQLSYVDGFYVKDTVNTIIGPGSWGYEITRLEQVVCTVTKDRNGREKQHVAYIATVRLNIEGCPSIEDVGYGEGTDPRLGAAIESAVKESITDAVKRCAASLGRRCGGALYDKEQSHVSDEPKPTAKPARKDVAKTPDMVALGKLGGPVSLQAWCGTYASALSSIKDAAEKKRCWKQILHTAGELEVTEDQVRQWLGMRAA